MKFLFVLLAWLILLAISWPLALAALVLLPVLWLVALPFRLVGVVVSAGLALVRALLLLPARLLGYKP